MSMNKQECTKYKSYRPDLSLAYKIAVAVMLLTAFAAVASAGDIIIKQDSYNVDGKLFVDSSGKIGVGTITPGAAIDIGGGMEYTNTNAVYQLYGLSEMVQLRHAGTSVINLVSDADTHGTTLGALAYTRSGGQEDAHRNVAGIIGIQEGTGTLAGGKLGFWTKGFGGAGSTKMVIDNIGNVGIGTTQPATRLEVSVPDATAGFRLKGTNGVLRVYPYYDGTYGTIMQTMNLAEIASTPLYIGSSKITLGSPLIGTGDIVSPAYPLQVSSLVAKTDTAWRFIAMLGSNEGPASDGLKFLMKGAAAQADRISAMQTGDGATNGGILSLQGWGGNVGIGTQSPTAALEVSAYKHVAPIAVFRNSGTDSAGHGIGIYTDSNFAANRNWGLILNTIEFGDFSIHQSNAQYGDPFAAGTSRLYIKGNGNIGIGTASPGDKLDVKGNIMNSNPSGGYLALSGDLPGHPVNTYPTLKTNFGYLYFSVGGLYSAYMDSGGVLTAVSDRAKKENFEEVDLQDTLAKIDQLPMYMWNFKSENSSIKHIAPVAQDFHALFGLNGIDNKMISNIDPPGIALVGVKALSKKITLIESGISVNITTGDVGIGTISPSAKLDVAGAVKADAFESKSDKALKKNVQPIENPLAKVKSLNGISFEWKDNDKKSIGLIAQDVEKVLPELVSTSSKDGLKSVSYGNIVALLVEAVKEQDRHIQEQDKKIEELEKKLKEQQN